MRKSLLFLLLCATQYLVAEPSQPADSYSFTYVKIGADPISVWQNDSRRVIFAGLGRRFVTNHWGIDISGQAGSHYLIAPRIQLLCYPQRSGVSPYIGGGASYGMIHSRKRRFTGLFAEGTLGLEFCKGLPCCFFIEGTISQPILSSSRKSDNRNPIVSVGLGAGF